MILVQTIKTQWTKASRGGDGASRRNTVPDALKVTPIAVNVPHPLPLFHQTTLFTESAEFQPSVTQTEIYALTLNKHLTLGCLRLIPAEEHLTITYAPTTICTGAPKRPHTRKEITLTPDTWAQIVYNGRFGWATGWSYHKTVFNIAYTDTFSENKFYGEPDFSYHDLADLW